MSGIMHGNRTIRTLTLGEELAIRFLGCRRHCWSWPTRDRRISYPSPYDSHVYCVGCGKSRLYDTSHMCQGPYFKPLYSPMQPVPDKERDEP